MKRIRPQARKLTKEEKQLINTKLLDCMHRSGCHTKEEDCGSILFWRGDSIYWMTCEWDNNRITMWGFGKKQDNPFEYIHIGQDLPMNAEEILTAGLSDLAQSLEDTVIKTDIAQFGQFLTKGSLPLPDASFFPAGTREVLSNRDEPCDPLSRWITERGGRALSAISFSPERSSLEEDTQELEQRFVELMETAGFEAQLHTDVVEPHSRLRAPFDEVWYWKGEDIYYAQFGRLNGSRIILGFFTQFSHAEKGLRISHTFHDSVSVYELLTSPNFKRFIPLIMLHHNDHCKVAATKQVLASPVVY